MVHTVPPAGLALLCLLMATDSVTARPIHSTATTTTTTFPPQPQLITLAPPVATSATQDPSFRDIEPVTAKEDQRVQIHDDDHDDNEDTDSDPHPSLANPRGHYHHARRSSGAFDVRKPLSRKGKARPLKNSSHGKRRDGSGRDADEDWRLWRSQYARQQQWRRCRTLQFGPCPD